MVSAEDLCGRNVFDTIMVLKERYTKYDVSVACIGPAGENKVLISAIMNDEHRAAERTGVGAIMGSKKLKAIVVEGKERPEVADKERLRKASKEVLEKIKKNSITGEGLPKYGTAVLVSIINDVGVFPHLNWKTAVNPKADERSGETLEKKHLIRRRACWGCPIGCGRVVSVKEDSFAVEYSEGPEYESIWALGSATGVSDLAAIIKANHYGDELGIDTISMGIHDSLCYGIGGKGKDP